MTTFYEMNLHQQTVRAVTDMGFEQATPIQEQIIPFAKEGKDVIGQAQTGTGKTASFTRFLPRLNRLLDVEEGHTLTTHAAHPNLLTPQKVGVEIS